MWKNCRFIAIFCCCNRKNLQFDTLACTLDLCNTYFEENQFTAFSDEDNFLRRKYSVKPLRLGKKHNSNKNINVTSRYFPLKGQNYIEKFLRLKFDFDNLFD